MNIPQITPFQMQSLEEVARGQCDHYTLVREISLDPPEQRARLINNNNETDQLVALGMLDNISIMFGKEIWKNIEQTGRSFRVFRITDMGRLLFQASCSQRIH